MSEKSALITGAGTGIGRACALALGRMGFSVALSGRRREPLEAVAEDARKIGAKTLVAPADVGDPKAVSELFEAVKAAFGRLDLLFNNAGISAPGLALEDLTYEQWKAVVDANLTGAFLCTQQAFRLFKTQTPRGGRIINNGGRIRRHTPQPSTE